MGNASYYTSLEMAFWDENFDKSSFVVWQILKELQGAPESILSHLYH